MPLREIAEAIARGLKVPVVARSPNEAAEHFGWLGFFVGRDTPALITIIEIAHALKNRLMTGSRSVAVLAG